MTSPDEKSPENGSMSNGSVANDRSTTSPSGISHHVAKRALLICWALAVGHIWLASDSIDGPYMDDNDVDERLRYEGYYPPMVDGGAIRHAEEQMHKLRVTFYDDDTIHTQQRRRDNSIENEQADLDVTLIPEALQHITYKNCCVPAIYKDYAQPNDIKCFGTCYNERACNDPVYPYSSPEEREKFGNLKVLAGEERQILRDRCIYKPHYLMPNATWCSKSTEAPNVIPLSERDPENPNNGSNQKSSSTYGDIPEPGCSLVTNGGGSGPWQHVFVFPSAKLAFCGIPKVGITQWIQFARFVAGAKDYPSLPHYKLDTDFFRFDKLDPSVQQEIWQDEKEWTWAAFVREPAERLLSAYLDKVSKKSALIQEALGLNPTTKRFTFNDFVERLTMDFNRSGCKKDKVDKTPDILSGMTGLNWCSDPHWRPQIMACGLFARLDRFQFVGDINNSPDNARELLQHVGLWESHGKRFVNGGVDEEGTSKLHMCHLKSHPYNYTKHVGFQQRDEKRNSTAANTAYGHSTSSQSKLLKYYSPELLTFVRHSLFADDYKLYQLVSKRKKLTSGKEIAMKLSRTKC